MTKIIGSPLQEEKRWIKCKTVKHGMMPLSLSSLITTHYSYRGTKAANEAFTGCRELTPCPSNVETK